jgi:roadblock/LC7 domain-containing protein
MTTLSKLKELVSSIPGAFVAWEFADDGKLIAYYGDIDQKTAEVAAMVCAANKLMGNVQAKGWSAYTGQEGFYPVIGFAVASGKYAAFVVGNLGVFVELSKADFDKTFEVLSKYL